MKFSNTLSGVPTTGNCFISNGFTFKKLDFQHLDGKIFKNVFRDFK